MRILICCALSTLLVGLPRTLAAGDPQETLRELMEERWEFQLSENPLLATRVGDNRFNAALPRMTLADDDRRRDREASFLDRLQRIDRDRLDADQQLNYDILRRLLEYRLAEYSFKTSLIPITNRDGFHISFPELRRQAPLASLQDYENYISRLRQFRDYAAGHVELMTEGLKLGYTLPNVVLAGFDEAIQVHIVDDATKSLLYEPFTRFPASVPQQQRPRLIEEGKQAILEGVVPGYQLFLDFMAGTYVPQARGTIGAAALPNGRQFYQHRVRRFTTLDLLPEQVHQTGVQEVARIRGEMQEIIDQVGFTGSFAEFLQFLRTDDQFYVDTADELLKEVAFVLKKIDGQLPRLFKTLPRTPYGIRVVPAYIAPRTTTAYYIQPSGAGTDAGFYYVNTYNLRSRPLYEIEALSLHEAVPGHHLQIALQQELENLPQFRRFSEFTVFVEGWALYAERLGLEVGFYEDPYRDFGRLTYEMWRACRLVVDTGIHYLGWSRERAIEFMAENSALSLHNIRAEVDRYISWPGQALAYKIGELKIRELRGRAEQQLGDGFDLREFHEVVLGAGAVPLDILEARVQTYIDESPP